MLSDNEMSPGAMQEWIEHCVDRAEADELADLLARAQTSEQAREELRDRFAASLRFGTAGLRGPLRAGPNGMNRSVVRRTAAGLAAWLTEQARSESESESDDSHGRPSVHVVVGYDARHGSRVFALDSAGVFAAAGLRTVVLPCALPTPVLAFAVRRLGAELGVMVTASHNPAADNGYKVYLADGAQLVAPFDTQIEQAITRVGPADSVALADTFRTDTGALVGDYVDAVCGLAGEPNGWSARQGLRIVHTALHGVGWQVLRDVMLKAGFTTLLPVAEQAEPDPDFPSVAFPNPEEPGALDQALALAADEQADIVIANDPDADRCAVAVPVDGHWRALTGDEVGVLLADAMMRRGVAGTYATTIVSSTMLGALARLHGVKYAETLTGFKWISRAAPDLVFGYEEALGYAVSPGLVRDKDGISAALAIAVLAAELKTQGRTLLDRLDELAHQVGSFTTSQVSLRLPSTATAEQLLRRLRADPPRRFAGAAVTVHDLLPEADVLRFDWAHGRVVIRPSGTEPKLKAYLELRHAYGHRDEAEADMAALHAEVEALLAQ